MGKEEMSHEQATAFEKVIMMAIDAAVVQRETGQREQLVAVSDQIDTYKKEFNATLKINFGDDIAL